MRFSFGNRRRPRGPSRSGDDAIKRAEARFLRKIEKEDPATWADLMKKRLGIGQTDPLHAFLEMRKQLAAAGLDPSGEAKGSEIREWVQGIGMALPAFFQYLNQTRGGPATIPPGPTILTHEPAQVEAPSVTPDPVTDPGPGGNAVRLTLESQFVIAKLKSLGTPENMAHYLDSMSDPAVRKFVTAVRDAGSDEDLQEIGAEFLRDKPEFAGAFAWLQNQGDLLAQIIDAVRQGPVAARTTGL